MTEPTYAVVAIGNAIVDVLAPADDAFLAENAMTKGAMQLIFTTEEAEALYAKMAPGQTISGGSAANTVAGMAALGANLLLTLVALLAAGPLMRLLGHKIEAVITRLLGVLLAALAVQFVIDGVQSQLG